VTGAEAGLLSGRRVVVTGGAGVFSLRGFSLVGGTL